MTIQTDTTIYVNSYAWMVRNVIFDRLKLVPPFNANIKKFSRVPRDQIQPEHIPFFGCYLLPDDVMEGGSNNQTIPQFPSTEVVLGFSYALIDNDADRLEEMLDAGYWSIMKLLHDPNWHRWPNKKLPNGIDRDTMIEGITRIARRNKWGLASNGMPLGEMEMEWHIALGNIYFEPIVTDLFIDMHFKTIPQWPDDPNRQPIITEWVVDQNAPDQKKWVLNEDA